MRKLHIFLVLLYLIPFYSLSQDAKELYFDLEIGIIEHLNDTIPGNITLTNTEGEKVNLKEIIDKPTVLMFVYFRCPGICTPLMDGVAQVVEKSDLKLGEDYQIISISFDPGESTLLAMRKRNNYKTLIGDKSMDGWNFFTSDSLNIARATQATGFRYKKTGNDFLHAATLIILSPKGQITRYLNGTYFLPFEFKLAIAEASRGQSGPTINKILQFCYSYDPAGQAYVLNITKITASLIIAIVLLFFITLLLKRPMAKNKHK